MYEVLREFDPSVNLKSAEKELKGLGWIKKCILIKLKLLQEKSCSLTKLFFNFFYRILHATITTQTKTDPVDARLFHM